MSSPHQPTFTPYTLPPVLQGQPTAVFKLVGGMLFPLPSVRWTEITYRKGPYAPRATFRYAYGEPAGFAGAPFEAVMPILKSVTTFDTVMLDDRIVVATIDTNGELAFLFDGFVQIPEASVSGQNYAQTFQAQGTAIRCWDTPMMGSYRLNANDPVPDDFSKYKHTYLPARVNPDGKPNCTGMIADNGTTRIIPAFTDDLLAPDKDGKVVIFNRNTYLWDLVSVACYCLNFAGTKYVDTPGPVDYERLLVDYKDDGTPAPIYCRDMVLSGKPWPEALHQAIRNHGFTFTFRLGTKGGLPYNYLTFERERDGLGSPLKSLYMQTAGTTIDPGATNTKAFSIAVDSSQVVNQYYVDRKCDEYEVGVILAPAFPVVAADANTPQKWLASNTDPAADRDKYRLFTADECGEGHYFLSSKNYLQGFPFKEWDLVWGTDWVVRRRPGYGPCFSQDLKGQRYKPQLAILTNWGVNGMDDPPRLFKKWVDIVQTPYIVPIKGSWELLHDRLGVRITCENPMSWKIGKIDPSNPAYGKVPETIDLVNNLLSYDHGNPQKHLFLMLTCVVSSDRKGSFAEATKRAISPTQFAVTRTVDAHDRYKRWAVHKSSAYQQAGSLYGEQVDDVRARYYARDDSQAAITYAESLRASTETPNMGGSVTIGRLTNAYFVGDRINSIYPRMSLQTSIPDKNIPNRFPMVVQVTWRNEPEQSTTLQLDDRRSESDPVEL